MKYGEILIDSNKIEFYNSIIGVEKIIVNGKEVSKKFGILGATHNFVIDKDNYKLISKCNGCCTSKINIIINKNGEKIYEGLIPINKKHRIYWFSLGVIIGLLLVKLILDKKF